MNQPVRIVIAEDEMIIAEDLKEILEILGYEVIGIGISAREVLQLVEEYNPSLALLDIQLKGGMDGIDLAREIRDHYRIPFLFLTSHADQSTILRAKEVNPYGYLLKPFDQSAIHAAVEMAMANFDKEIEKETAIGPDADMILHDSLFVRSNGMLVKVKFEDILYMEADGNYSNIYTRDKKYTLRCILKTLEEKLSSLRFARIHKSYLVNLAQIDAIDSQSVFMGGKEIPISRSQHGWLLKKIKTL